jgi:LVIVD repeat-containing protein
MTPEFRRSLVGSLLWVFLFAPAAFGQPSILGGAKERQPSYGELENFTILSYTDLDGWDQAAEFRISKDGKHAYISNYQGFSIVDVSDPSKPRVISKVKNDPSVQSQYIDVLGNLLAINQDGVRDEKIKSWEGGIRLYDYQRSG